MRASSILVLARIVIVSLAQWVINLDVIGSVGGVSQDGHVLSSKFVGFDNGLEIPVSPVQVIVHDAKSKDMWSFVL